MDAPPAASAIDGMVAIAGALAGQWTPNQALAIQGALAGMTQKQIAAAWKEKISCQAVGKHLKRAKWPAIRHGVKIFEKSLKALVPAVDG